MIRGIFATSVFAGSVQLSTIKRAYQSSGFFTLNILGKLTPTIDIELF